MLSGKDDFLDPPDLIPIQGCDAGSVVGDQLDDVAGVVAAVTAVDAVSGVSQPRQDVGAIVEGGVHPERVHIGFGEWSERSAGLP